MTTVYCHTNWSFTFFTGDVDSEIFGCHLQNQQSTIRRLNENQIISREVCCNLNMDFESLYNETQFFCDVFQCFQDVGFGICVDWHWSGSKPCSVTRVKLRLANLWPTQPLGALILESLFRMRSLKVLVLKKITDCLYLLFLFNESSFRSWT